MQESQLAIRRLQYRLNRQGMLELDAWLAGLVQAKFSDPAVIAAIEGLLSCEPPELQSMMKGERTVPEALKAWL